MKGESQKSKIVKLKVVKSLGSLKAVIAIILALTMISMVQSDRKERVQECASKAGEGAIYLKEFVVSLPKGVKDEAPPSTARQ